MYRMMILEASVFPDPLSPAIKKQKADQVSGWMNALGHTWEDRIKVCVCVGGGAVQF